ncbi:hypothetical protein BpHYR1_019449, partial [Brachionus plicatilis]
CARSHPSYQVPKKSCSDLTNGTRLNLSKIQFQFVSKKLIRFHHYQECKRRIKSCRGRVKLGAIFIWSN